MLSDSWVKKEIAIEDELEARRKADLLEEMGITQHDVDKLRKSMLSPAEAVHAKSEELTRIRQHKGRKEDWEEFVDIKRRMGRVMHHSEFIRRLRTVVPSLIVAPGRVRNQLGLYMVRSAPVRECPDEYLGTFKHHYPQPVYIGWVDMGVMPEYEVDIVNSAQVPISQKRGWRTILLRMIERWNYVLEVSGASGTREIRPKLDINGQKVKASRASIITENQALEAFGYPTQGLTASYYRHQLWRFRNGY